MSIIDGISTGISNQCKESVNSKDSQHSWRGTIQAFFSEYDGLFSNLGQIFRGHSCDAEVRAEWPLNTDRTNLSANEPKSWQGRFQDFKKHLPSFESSSRAQYDVLVTMEVSKAEMGHKASEILLGNEPKSWQGRFQDFKNHLPSFQFLRRSHNDMLVVAEGLKAETVYQTNGVLPENGSRSWKDRIQEAIRGILPEITLSQNVAFIAEGTNRSIRA